MNKHQLASKIWESANKMRSKIEANEYKDYILGFIFYKFLSDNEVRRLREQGWEQKDIEALSEDDQDTMKYVQDNVGYFIAYKDLFSTWLAMGKDFDVSNVTDALSAFSRLISPKYKKVFEKIFETLETGLSKLGDSAANRTKAISDLIHLIKDIPMDGKQGYDVLGFIYEYLISQFAANAGKKAGEFYTPHEVSLLMSEIVAWHLRGRQEIKIYDPTSGSGSLLINIGHSVAKQNGNDNSIRYYAQELKQNTYNLTRMNLIMRGILPDNIETRNGDTLEQDWPWFDESDPVATYDPLYVDAVVSNPPYSQHWDPSGKESDPRYARFGLAPKSKADYAFLLHDLYHLKPDGIMTIVLPHGVLFRGGEEGEIRRNLIEHNHIDAIIGLPSNIFFGTGIPTIIMVLRQKREHTDVLIVDASKGFEKVGKNNRLRSSDIRRIVDTYTERADLPKYARAVSRDEIRRNDYNLNIPRYVDSSEGAETWDVYASMFGGIPLAEIDVLAAEWAAFPGLKDALFQQNGTPYAALAVGDVRTAIHEHSAVRNFTRAFDAAFADFPEFLRHELIDKCDTLHTAREENALADIIFKRLSSLPLIDRYEAYQLLDDSWARIAVDLEVIQTEGFDAVRKVDPHMVIKKKGDKESEVQDGWVGHVLPFELVQHSMLSAELAALKSMEDELIEIAGVYDALLEGIAEEDKTGDCFSDDGSSFVPAAVKKEARQYRAAMKKGAIFAEDSVERKIIEADELITREADTKKQIKAAKETLEAKTRALIEALTDQQAKALLYAKWIEPLVHNLYTLPQAIIASLTEKVKALSAKYEVTLAGVEAEIAETEAALVTMLGQLTGNPYDMAGLQELRTLLGGESNE